jgi:hypothetical protein
MNPKCQSCKWGSPETCKACQGENKVIVLAVNKGGIKPTNQ